MVFTGASVGSPIDFESMLFEARRGPKSKHGIITGHGNLVEAKATWKIPGRIIAVSQRKVFNLSRRLFSDVVIEVTVAGTRYAFVTR
jgi:hypothetical protein